LELLYAIFTACSFARAGYPVYIVLNKKLCLIYYRALFLARFSSPLLSFPFSNQHKLLFPQLNSPGSSLPSSPRLEGHELGKFIIVVLGCRMWFPGGSNFPAHLPHYTSSP